MPCILQCQIFSTEFYYSVFSAMVADSPPDLGRPQKQQKEVSPKLRYKN